MPAVTLTQSTVPYPTKITSVPDTLQRLVFADGLRKVTIRGDAAWYLDRDGTQGAAVSAHAFPMDANTPYEFALTPGSGGKAIGVAAQSGTANLYVLSEGAL